MLLRSIGPGRAGPALPRDGSTFGLASVADHEQAAAGGPGLDPVAQARALRGRLAQVVIEHQGQSSATLATTTEARAGLVRLIEAGRVTA